MKTPTILKCFAAMVASTLGVHADIAADFASITGTTAGQTVSGWGGATNVARHGAAAFPVLLDADSASIVAAGRYNDSYAPTAARAVAFGHDALLSGGGDSMPALIDASVKWASRKTTPSTITVGCGAGVSTSFWTSRGYLTKTVTTAMSSSANDLSGVDVFFFSWHSGYSASAVTKIQAFTAAGGGIVCVAKPWALGDIPLADAYNVLTYFGLTYGAGGWDGGASTTVPTVAPSPIYSAFNGSSELIRAKEGLITMTLADKLIAANSVDQVLAARSDLTALNADMDTLGNASHYGWIAPTLAAPVARPTKPVEAMLVRYQSKKFDAMTPAQLFAHPSASDFPGSPSAGSMVSKTVSVNGNTPVDFYMNQGSKPTRIETGVYAAPGATITVTIPADKTAAGLQVHIAGNGSEDTTWNSSSWTYFPKLWRRVPLTSASTQTGNVFGGLVTILMPAGSNLGTFNVTVSGVLEAPCFVLGTNTDSEWNSGLSTKPAPYGYLKTEKLTIYMPKPQLTAMTNPTAVANHWKTVMDTTDEYYGYTNWRKRGEALATSRYVSAGSAYAGYPVELGWGTDDDSNLDGARVNGSWGNYHELGHGYQDNFDGAFGIATHAEIDVNLMPAMVYSMVHHQTTWEYSSGFYGSAHRISHRAAFLALPAAQQTWGAACENNSDYGTAYDFYYNLSDAFGWGAYKTAFTRLMNYLQNPTGSTDTELKNLSSSDPNFKRNRFYLLFCDATGRNLDTYFQRYGLGKVGGGFEITQSVKNLVSSKGYPVWSDNAAPTAISNPGTVSLPEDTPAGTVVHAFTVTDADPGETYEYQITAGDPNGAFVLDKKTGVLTVGGIDYENASSYALTVTAYGDSIPLSGTRNSIARSFTVNVVNTPDSPAVAGKLFTATSAMSSGTVLGSATATLDPSRTLSSWEITAGNGSGIFAINASGQVTLQTPGALGSPAAYQLTLRATDSTGLSGYGQVIVYANGSLGVREERWTGQVISGSPAYSGYRSSFVSAQNVAENYIRRLSGWLVPPTSGLYTFWIASDDGSTLSLGTDATSASKVAIASVSGHTGFQSWDEKTSQKSITMYLAAGTPYYIEAIQEEGGGGDHVAVAWKGPGITRQVIPGSVLVPAAPGVAISNYAPAAPTIALSSPADEAVYPDPATVGINATVGDNGNTVSKVQFFQGSTLLAEDYLPPYSVTWNSPAIGNYVFTAKAVYSGGTVTSSAVNIAVVHVNHAPTFTANPIAGDGATGTSAYAGSIASYGSDVDAGDSLTYAKVSGPSWLTVANDGSLGGTPLQSDVGTNSFTVKVTDQAGANANATLNIAVALGNSNGVFTSLTGGPWMTKGNWSGGVIANGTGKTADFSTLNLTADTTVTLDGARTIGNLTFGDTTASNNWTLNTGSGGPLTLDVTTGVPTITVNNRTATLNVVLAGTEGLAKTGAGNLTLGGANTYSGGTTITPLGDTTAITVANGAGLGSGAVLLNGVNTYSAGLSVNTGLAIANALTLKPTTTRAVLGLSGNANWSGPIIVDGSTSGGLAAVLGGGTSASSPSTISGNVSHTGASANLFVLRNSGGYGSITGSIAYGTGTVQLLDTTNWQFSNTSNTWGTLDISNAGAFAYVGSTNTLAPAGVVSSTVGGTLRLSNLAGTSSYNQSIAGLGGNVKVAVTTGAATLTLNTMSNQSSSGVISGAVSLVKSGTAVQTLSGINTNTGATTISGGTLNVTGSLSTGAVTVQSGGTLGGSGSVNGATTVQSGGILAPGNAAPGTFSAKGNLTLNANSILNLELGTTSDQIAFTGTTFTAPSSGTVVINVSAAAGFATGTYPVITGATGITASRFSIGSVPGGYSATMSASSGTLSVVVGPSGLAAKGNTGTQLDLLDSDGDGRSDRLEYATGTQPDVAEPGTTGTLGKTPDATKLTLTFHRIADPSLVYTVQGTDNPAGEWQTVWSSTGAVNTDGDVTVEDIVPIQGHSQRFLRLVVGP